MFTDRKRIRRRRSLLVLAVVATALFIMGLTTLEPVPELEAMQALPEAPGTAEDLSTSLADVPRANPEFTLPETPAKEVVEGAVQRGETASALLSEFLSARDIYRFASVCKDVFPLTRIQAGRPYCITVSDGAFTRFEYEFSKDEKLVVEASEDGYAARREAIVYDIKSVLVEGTIQSNLYQTVDDAGEHPSLAVRLSDIFAWDVDFVRDIRSGDSFRALVEKRYRKGEFAGYGTISAARFVNQGQTFNGFLFEDESGFRSYYDENGRSLRKAFLKAPLAFRRISSGFNLRRLHPILKIRRPHPGIDYAAPTGTPVKTVGDGVVMVRGWDRGGGNYIKIRHNSVYETSYMHLSRFAKGLKKGKRVYQGQIIGYVGSTGMSTGPHLDFRMKKNGSFVNPRTIKSPSAKPVPEALMARFKAVAGPLRAALDGQGPVRVTAAIP